MHVDLNTQCRIEYKSVTQDADYGTEVITWKKLANIWCEKQDVMPSRSSESIQSGVEISTLKSRIRMRYRNDIDSSMRLIIGTNTYQIVSEPAELGRRQYIEFMVEKYSS